MKRHSPKSGLQCERNNPTNGSSTMRLVSPPPARLPDLLPVFWSWFACSSCTDAVCPKNVAWHNAMNAHVCVWKMCSYARSQSPSWPHHRTAPPVEWVRVASLSLLLAPTVCADAPSRRFFFLGSESFCFPLISSWMVWCAVRLSDRHNSDDATSPVACASG